MKRLLSVLICVSLCVCLFGCSSKPDEATQMVIDEIAKLEQSDHVTLAEIEKAKERYNSLSDKQKEKVSNYSKLMEIEDNYAELGKIELTLENCADYLDITGDWLLAGENTKKKAEGNTYVYDFCNNRVDVTGHEKIQYNDVKITIEFYLDYFPYTLPQNNSRGNYGLRAGTTNEMVTKNYIIECDEFGKGSATDVIECQNGMFGVKGINKAEFKITEVSGTVLPLE